MLGVSTWQQLEKDTRQLAKSAIDMTATAAATSDWRAPYREKRSSLVVADKAAMREPLPCSIS